MGSAGLNGSDVAGVVAGLGVEGVAAALGKTVRVLDHGNGNTADRDGLSACRNTLDGSLVIDFHALERILVCIGCAASGFRELRRVNL